MFEFLKHISPKTKILFLAFILILIPGAVISYLSLLSINQKAENIRTKYSGTIRLVRDKLESEVLQIESNLRNSIIELLPKQKNDTDLKIWLRNMESKHPTLKNLFLVNADGGLITASVSLGWNKMPDPRPLINPKAAANFDRAEKAEFIRKDFAESIGLYRNAMINTKSSSERVLLTCPH